MARITIPDKVLEKWAKEDVELHKRVITTYLFSEKVRLKTRNKLFKLYDHYINEGNIYDYFYIPVHILVTALVLNELDRIMSYIQTPNPHRTNKKPKPKKRNRKKTS